MDSIEPCGTTSHFAGPLLPTDSFWFGSLKDDQLSGNRKAALCLASREWGVWAQGQPFDERTRWPVCSLLPKRSLWRHPREGEVLVPAAVMDVACERIPEGDVHLVEHQHRAKTFMDSNLGSHKNKDAL